MYAEYLKLAKDLALVAGNIMQQGDKIEIREKAPADFVTNIDTAIEAMVREKLNLATPDFGILGEEGAGLELSWQKELNQEYCWVLDPLDGTANFAFEIPHFAFSLALLHHKEPVVGVVYDPKRNELFYAEKGKGAFLNDQKIKVGTKSEIGSSIVAIGLASTSREYLEANKFWFGNILDRFGKVRSLGASALDLCWLAMGRLDAFFQIRIKPWDVAAAAVICKEAGAKLTSLDEHKRIEFNVTAGSVFSSNDKLFEAFFHEEL